VAVFAPQTRAFGRWTFGTVAAMNPAAERKAYPEITFRVEPQRVASFRSIFGIERGVPPTFITAAEFAVMPLIVEDPELGLDFTRVLHASQEYEAHRPLREGETLSVRAHIDSIRQRGATGFLTIVMELLDAESVVVGTARSTMVERGADG
jgi:hypothetical protein